MSVLMDKVQALEISTHHQYTRIDILEKSNKKLENILLEKSKKIAYMEDTIQQLQQTVMQMATKQAAGYTNQTDLLENFEELSIRTVQEPKVHQDNHRQGLFFFYFDEISIFIVHIVSKNNKINNTKEVVKKKLLQMQYYLYGTLPICLDCGFLNSRKENIVHILYSLFFV